MTNLNKHICLLVSLLFLVTTSVKTQTDTAFWFVAPEISQGQFNYDRPVAFWVSTYDVGATITLSQPGNPGFLPQTLTIGPASSGSFSFPPFFDQVENAPPNAVLNRGFLLTSTTPITAYYEVLCEYKSNPDIFALKGRNALGTKFYLPFQQLMPNSSSYLPLPSAAFDVVATQNGTVVTITPTTNIVGHAAGIPFSVNLNKGQTYSGKATSQQALGHPSGTKITSNHPIAVTVKDDLLESGAQYGGGMCRDLIGDQLIPVEKIGTRYIVQKGELNSTEHTIVVGTENNTQIKLNGQVVTIIGEGETYVALIEAGSYFIESSKPVYVFQITGQNCEVGGAVLPAMDCTGSMAIRFVRADEDKFSLFLSTRSGNETGFSINGDPNLINASAFHPVPGSNGEFVAAKFDFSTLIVPVDFSSLIENSKGVFHMSFLNGGAVTGCRFGYFSDFSNWIVSNDTVSICMGDTLRINNQLITNAGVFERVVSNPIGCDTLYRTTVGIRDLIWADKSVYFCQGSSVTINNQEFFQSGSIIDTINSGNNGCDTVVFYTITQSDFIPKSQGIQTCYGEPLELAGKYYQSPGQYLDTIQSQTGCDTLLNIDFTWKSWPEVARTVLLCPGERFLIGTQFYTAPAIVTDTIFSHGEDCDTIRTNILENHLSPTPFLPPDTIICPGSNILLSSPYPYTQWNKITVAQTFEIQDPGTVTAYFVDENGCPGRDTLRVATCCSERNIYIPNAFSPNDDGQNDAFCVFTTEQCSALEMQIYDRWGELLFKSAAEPLECWNGDYRGRNMPSGVYVCMLLYFDQQTRQTSTKTQAFTLIR